jgi:hypothetical protein
MRTGLHEELDGMGRLTREPLDIGMVADRVPAARARAH